MQRPDLPFPADVSSRDFPPSWLLAILPSWSSDCQLNLGRWRRSRFAGSTAGAKDVFSRRLFDGADQILDLLRVRAEFFRQLVQIGVGDSNKGWLIDFGDDLDTDRLQLVLRLMLEFDRLGRLALVHLVSGRLHPPLLLGRQAIPKLVAYPNQAVVSLVLGH